MRLICNSRGRREKKIREKKAHQWQTTQPLITCVVPGERECSDTYKDKGRWTILTIERRYSKGVSAFHVSACAMHAPKVFKI
jgi:hypothetical protein